VKTPPSSKAAAAVPFVDDGRPTEKLSEAELADAYFDRKSRVDAFKPIGDRAEALAKEIRNRYQSEDAAKEFELKSPSTIVQIGAKQLERSVSIHAVFRISKMKIVDFLELCKITLGEVEKIPGAAPLIQSVRTGFRTLKAIKRMPAAAE
jgi:hypothetical protein